MYEDLPKWSARNLHGLARCIVCRARHRRGGSHIIKLRKARYVWVLWGSPRDRQAHKVRIGRKFWLCATHLQGAGCPAIQTHYHRLEQMPLPLGKLIAKAQRRHRR